MNLQSLIEKIKLVDLNSIYENEPSINNVNGIAESFSEIILKDEPYYKQIFFPQDGGYAFKLKFRVKKESHIFLVVYRLIKVYYIEPSKIKQSEIDKLEEIMMSLGYEKIELTELDILRQTKVNGKDHYWSNEENSVFNLLFYMLQEFK